jgi:hypothetical protein
MGWMAARSALEGETVRYSGNFRVMRMISLGVAACGGRAFVLRAEPRVRASRPCGRRSLTRAVLSRA